MFRRSTLAFALTLCAPLAACSDSTDSAVGSGGTGGTGGGSSNGVTQLVRSELTRAAASPEEAAGAAGDTRSFAWDFYRQIADSSENLVYSPYSISVAATMLSAGAGRNTLAEMEAALHMSTDPSSRHQSHNALAQSLESRNHEATEQTNAQILRVSNDFWMHPRLSPSDPFMDTLATAYDSGVHLAPFDTDPEGSRQAINAKVSDDTNALIDELLPEGSIDTAVVFVLTNALYFKSRWASEFSPDLTAPEPFNAIDGSTPTVDMMNQVEHYGYVEGAGYRAASLPYFGHELDFVVVLPDPGTFDDFVSALDDTTMQGIYDGFTHTKLDLGMPKIDMNAEVRLKEQLEAAGMIDAFTPGIADFTSIASDVFISAAFHQAAIIIDEEGTEAAAATAFVGSATSAPPPEEPVPFKLDHPFLFVLRDVATNTPLFVGHYVGI